MIFCANFLLTRKIICAILEPQRETNGQPKGRKEKNKMLMNKENHYSYIFMLCNDMGIIEE